MKQAELEGYQNALVKAEESKELIITMKKELDEAHAALREIPRCVVCQDKTVSQFKFFLATVRNLI